MTRPAHKTTRLKPTRFTILCILGLFFSLSSCAQSASQSVEHAHDETRIVILGTGTPVPTADRSGPGVAIITNGEAYVFDAGGGMVKSAVKAALTLDIPELTPQNINYLFITHLHSDHIHDISELASSRWWGRQQRLSVFGPKGIKEYSEHMAAMSSIEADIRAAGTPDQLITDREGYRTNTSEIEEGIVFRNDDISIEAFTVPHGDIRPAFGYRIVTHDKTIVISGDTAYSETLAEKAKGADILIHEVFSGDALSELNEFWQFYHGSSHTSTQEVAQIANIAQPALLVLYHTLFFGSTAEGIVREVSRDYSGEVVLANDLDIF